MCQKNHNKKQIFEKINNYKKQKTKKVKVLVTKSHSQ